MLKYNAHVIVTTTFHPSKSFLIVFHLNTTDTRSYLVLTIVPLSIVSFLIVLPYIDVDTARTWLAFKLFDLLALSISP